MCTRTIVPECCAEQNITSLKLSLIGGLVDDHTNRSDEAFPFTFDASTLDKLMQFTVLAHLGFSEAALVDDDCRHKDQRTASADRVEVRLAANANGYLGRVESR